jgi:hypothetical protein
LIPFTKNTGSELQRKAELEKALCIRGHESCDARRPMKLIITIIKLFNVRKDDGKIVEILFPRRASRL